jgi:3-hydroxyacyl-[acyl-carrier-protein] dehydratase
MNELYSITAGPEDGLFEVRLNPDHSIFSGHFPGNPVLPGVCSMMIVRECASQMAGRPLRYASVRESKFLEAITPGPILSVRLKLATEDEGFNLDAAICCAERIMVKLKARLAHDE